jgi:hypothetical protein
MINVDVFQLEAVMSKNECAGGQANQPFSINSGKKYKKMYGEETALQLDAHC